MTRFSAVASAIWFGLSGPAFAGSGDCSERLDVPRTQDIGRPVLVLMATDPWAMVLGSDSPRFVLYGNGLAIYRTKEGYRQILLDGKRAADLRKAVNVGALACLNTHYSIAEMTDQPSELLFFGRGGRLSNISVYGSIPDRGVQTDLPLPLVAAYERLAAFNDAKARPWMPDYIEVMVWPYEYAPETSIIWPSKWPGLNDPSTVKRHDGYSLYVPSKDFAELLAFLRTEPAKGAVEIGGKKWAVSFRFPFPQEASWQFKAGDPQ
jgi:hypothetical protein